MRAKQPAPRRPVHWSSLRDCRTHFPCFDEQYSSGDDVWTATTEPARAIVLIITRGVR
jgi:hypothetical protein